MQTYRSVLSNAKFPTYRWLLMLCLAALPACQAGEPAEVATEAVAAEEEVAEQPEAPPLEAVHLAPSVQPLSPRAPEPLPLPDTLGDGLSVAGRLERVSQATRVTVALQKDRHLRPYALTCALIQGRLVLLGRVRTADERRRVAGLARRASGVYEVINEIETVETDDSKDAGATGRGSPFHLVRPGETLWDIARSYGTSVRRIQQLNGQQSSAIHPGQRLRIR